MVSQDDLARERYEASLRLQRDEASRLYSALRQGREEGREQGRKEGREEGREQGRKEGREEGREEGRKEVREEARKVREEAREKVASMILVFLRQTLGDLNDETATKVNSLEFERLEQLVSVIHSIKSQDELHSWLA